MIKRILPLVFAGLLIGLFIWIWIARDSFATSAASRQTSRTIIPSTTVNHTDATSAMNESTAYDESRVQPMIALENDESFLQAINADLNRDGSTDQICAVKKIPESVIYLVPAMQNPVTGEYTRLVPIRTGVTQSRTLLFYILDIVGDRTDALVFSGMTSDNMQLLAVYLPITDKDGRFGYTAAADLRSDGPIVIREVPRYDAYQLGLTTGDSYPIVIYSSDPDSPDTLDQIERVYKWDKTVKRYIQTSESRVTGKKIESNLVRQLQSGDSDSFQSFLNGLWYVPSSESVTESRYVFFSSSESEVIFHNGITEEVFVIEAVVPRRYGIYLTTRNRSISSIRRLIDIELTGIDEIKINVREDVKLKIGVASTWDGVFRKMSSTVNAHAGSSLGSADILLQQLQTSSIWESDDRSIFTTEGFTYTLTGTAGSEKGQYAVLSVRGDPVIQLKPGENSASTRFFKVEADKTMMKLTEVTVSINGISYTGSSPVTYRKK